MKPFLFGVAPHVDDSALLSSEVAYQRVGDNTGNLAFCYAIDRMLGGGLQSVRWHAEPAVVDSVGDIGVLTLANQLGPHADLGYLAENFRKLKCNLVGVGLGAQAGNLTQEVEIPNGTLEWVRAIQERSPTSAPNIAARGEFSVAALDRYGLAEKAVALGCPTLFISNDKQLGQTIAKNYTESPKLFAIAAGHQRWQHLARLEASLVQLAHRGGAYICQSPIEMVRLGRGEFDSLSVEARDACRNYANPQMSDLEFSHWTRAHARSFFSASAWMEYLRRYDFVIGSRIHGVMLALQAGVPGLCIAHDSRTIELCQTMKIPYVLASSVSAGIRRDDIPSLFKFDPDEFDKNRTILATRYQEFLASNSLSPAQYLSDIATSTSA